MSNSRSPISLTTILLASFVIAAAITAASGEKLMAFFVGPQVSAIVSAAPVAPPPMPQPSAAVDFDFDGDGKADVGRWHSANAEFKIKNSNGGSFSTWTVGAGPSSARPAPADYDNDGKTDAATFDSGTWKIRKSSDGTTTTITGFGQAGDIPQSGNYTGSTADELAVYRPSNGTWYWREFGNSTVYSLQYGVSTDIPVIGDYDGDGDVEPTVYRSGVWWISGVSVVNWGVSGDVPVPADYDNDGKTDPAVFRPSEGNWYILCSSTSYADYMQYGWGMSGDQPTPGDYDGDGKADPAIWRQKTGMWWTWKTATSTYDAIALGVSGDFAVPSAYVKQVGGDVQQDDLAVARLAPKNATGRTNLYSQNFSWGTNLVNLPGRSGLDLNLGISYNSLIWTKVGSAIVFDPDNSNLAPGFRIGFPTIEPVYYDDSKSTYSYMMVTPSGGRVEFRQTAVSNTYDAVDSSYAQLVTTGASDPNDPVDNITITVTTTDGTQMTYLWVNGEFRCSQIKDRNGNYISATYNYEGSLTSVTDTLGRVITINYDTTITITQTWKDTNGSGSNTTHTWATFSFATKTLATDFDGLMIIGPPNGMSVGVLDKVTYSDGSATKFYYNDYAQVYKVSNIAADSSTHVLNYVRTNLESPAADQTDCPRFTETKSFVENFNSGSEVTFNNTEPTSGSYSLPGSLSGSASVVNTWMTGHPDNLRTKIYYGASGWKEGLTLATEDCLTTSSTCSDRRRWTWTDWTQDNTSLTYDLNPRVTESRVGDSSNTKRTTIAYYEPSTGVFPYGLPETVQVYAADLSTIIKKSVTTYNLSSNYTDRRIIDLPSMVKAWGMNDQTSSLEYVSKVTFDYDGTTPSSVSPTQHDGTNYGTGFNYRGNLTSTTRWDVTDDTNTSLKIVSSVEYNKAGSPISQTDPRGRVTRIGYTDSFNSSVGVSTYAYATVLTDAAGSSLGDASHSSTITYRYDIGANVEATSPAPAGQSYGKTSKRVFDSVGRLDKESIYVNTTEKFYKRYEYPSSGIESKSYSTITDTTGSTAGPDSADEVLTDSWFDGAGRLRGTRTEHPGSTGGWTASKTTYDILGHTYSQSVPTEVSVASPYDPDHWTAAGDDSTRGFIYNYSYYDWKGRPTKTVPSDSNGSDGKDTLVSYEGCGCAGGQITTIEGPLVPRTDTTGDARRIQKIYEDILGRTYKTETYDWNGTSVYSTIVNSFNGRDQVVLSRQYDGGTSSSTYQDTTFSLDGHGRVSTKHLPQMDTSAVVTYTYNPDDSIHDVTDGRGAVAHYQYGHVDNSSSSEYRSLLTKMTYSVPTSSEIAVPGDVSFSYDNIGNRTQMTDGLGTQSYAYDSLSEITSETRQFSDTLSNAPQGSSSFAIGYSYTLTGQLKSLTEPWGVTVNYTQDKVGRLTSVAPSSSFGGVSTFASNGTYRAWGALKHLEYSNGITMDETFNNRLQAASFNLATSSASVMQKDYEYYPDGNLKFVNDALNSKFDRSYTYDHLARLKDGKSSTEASGTTIPDGWSQVQNLPYRQSYTYNAFADMTERYSKFWGGDANLTLTYNFDSHHRITGSYSWQQWEYDADGRVTRTKDPEPDSEMQYDAVGRLVFTYDKPFPTERESKTTQYFDGDGQELKRTTDSCAIILPENPDDPCTWQGESSTYYIRSTVLGGEMLSETSVDAAYPLHRYVFAGGAKFAELSYRWDSSTRYDTALYYHLDAAGVSQRVTRNSPETLLGTSTMYTNYIDPRQQEYDSGGSNVGTVTNYVQQPAPPSDPGVPIDGDAYVYQDGQWGQVTVDGLPVSRQALRMMALGGALAVGLYDRFGKAAGQGRVWEENGDLHWVSGAKLKVVPGGWEGAEYYPPTVVNASYDTTSVSWSTVSFQTSRPFDIPGIVKGVDKVWQTPGCQEIIKKLLGAVSNKKNPLIASGDIPVLLQMLLNQKKGGLTRTIIPGSLGYGSGSGNLNKGNAIVFAPTTNNPDTHGQLVTDIQAVYGELMHLSGAKDIFSDRDFADIVHADPNLAKSNGRGGANSPAQPWPLDQTNLTKDRRRQLMNNTGDGDWSAYWHNVVGNLCFDKVDWKNIEK
jgi:YD repeat-containing protein